MFYLSNNSKWNSKNNKLNFHQTIFRFSFTTYPLHQSYLCWIEPEAKHISYYIDVTITMISSLSDTLSLHTSWSLVWPILFDNHLSKEHSVMTSHIFTILNILFTLLGTYHAILYRFRVFTNRFTSVEFMYWKKIKYSDMVISIAQAFPHRPIR